MPEFQLDPKFKMEDLFPGTPVSSGIDAAAPPPTLTTKLENGLIVASQDMPGMMTSLAFIVRAGSAYETQEGSTGNTLGATQFLEFHAFRSTENRTNQQLIEEVEQLGGMVQCIASRENIVYVMDVMRHQVKEAVDILADTTLQPIFPEEELLESRMVAEFQQQELPSEVFSRDLVQRAAYQKYPLGNHHFCPVPLVQNVTEPIIRDFQSKYFFGENCIVAIAGLDHETAVRLVREKFSILRAGERQADGLDLVGKSEFTGGMLTQERELKEPFAKLAMGFEVGGWSDERLVAVCVLQQLLGGGSSFSAGGPGKGMFTRLYTQVLNRYYWTESIEAFVSIHEHSGMLGIDGACPPDKLVNLIQVIMQQFSALALVPVPQHELTRAKNMLKSSMMMQLESRLVQCEDIARQFATYGKRDSPSVMCDKIDAVTAEDIMEVAQSMMKCAPAIGAVGADLSHLPPYEAIAEYCSAMYKSTAEMISTKTSASSSSFV